MSKNLNTVASVSARVDAIEAHVANQSVVLKEILALMSTSAPAKVAKKGIPVEEPAAGERTQCLGNTAAGSRCKRLSGGDFCPSHKAQAKGAKKTAAKATPAATPKTTKGSKTASEQSRKDFNRTVTAKARLAGGGTYKAILAAWNDVKAAGAAGETPDEIVARYTTK